MTNFRNAIKRVTHKERSQPIARQHLGILEKKKDYQVRAKDYHRKENTLQNMRRKAAMKNPDEFYFGMKNSQLVDGYHRKTQASRVKEMEDSIGPDAVKVMKTQDLSYIRLQCIKDQKKIDRMQASLHCIGDGANTHDLSNTNTARGPQQKKHTVFVGTKDEAESFDVAQYFDTIPEFAGRAFNRPRKDSLIKTTHTSEDGRKDKEQCGFSKHEISTQKTLSRREKEAKKMAKTIAKARLSAYREMEQRKKRLEKMKRVEAHLVTEKIVSSKGRKRKIAEAVNGKPAVYVFRRKRAD